MVSFQGHYPPATQGNTQILYAKTHEYIFKMAKTSELHNTINCSFSSLVLSLTETLASHESLDSESPVRADIIWLCSVPRFGLPEEALAIHTIQNFHSSHLWSISAKYFRLAWILWPHLCFYWLLLIGCLHTLTHSFYQHWQYSGKLTSFRHHFLRTETNVRSNLTKN